MSSTELSRGASGVHGEIAPLRQCNGRDLLFVSAGCVLDALQARDSQSYARDCDSDWVRACRDYGEPGTISKISGNAHLSGEILRLVLPCSPHCVARLRRIELASGSARDCRRCHKRGNRYNSLHGRLAASGCALDPRGAEKLENWFWDFALLRWRTFDNFVHDFLRAAF